MEKEGKIIRHLATPIILVEKSTKKREETWRGEEGILNGFYLDGSNGTDRRMGKLKKERCGNLLVVGTWRLVFPLVRRGLCFLFLLWKKQ